jgi:hypothetical protein
MFVLIVWAVLAEPSGGTSSKQMISNSIVTDGSAQAADVNTPSINDQTASHQPPRSVSPETDEPVDLQPQQRDPRFKNVEVSLYGRALELYREIVTAFPEEVLEMWDEHYQKEVLDLRDRYYDREKTHPVTRTEDELAYWTRTRVEQEFQNYAKDIEMEEARQRRINSPEYKAEQEARRIAREKQEAEYQAKREFWADNQGRRRQKDALLPPENLIEREWDFPAQENAHEFYQEFLSAKHMGYTAQYEPRMTGYRLPEESGLDQYLFDLSGVVYDQTVFLETGEWEGGTERIGCSSFVWTYGMVVCGYDISAKTGRFPDKEDYKRSILGYVTWLREQIGEQEKARTGHLPGTPEYWLNLFGHITLAYFKKYTDEELTKSPYLTEPPRTLFKLVEAYMNDKVEQSFYSELKDEKAFKQFLLECMPGGRYAEIADLNKNCYFTVANASRPKNEKFKITFSNPKDRELPMEVIESIMANAGLKLHKMEEPPKNPKDPFPRPINWEEHNREAAELREQYEREWEESQA